VSRSDTFTNASSLFEVDSFDDASSPCKIAAGPFVPFSAMFDTNETLVGPKSSGKKTGGLKE
jgi:hypothetical protein